MEITSKIYGLVGKNIGYSFSKGYFTEKFVDLHLRNCSYENFDIAEIAEFPHIIKENPNISGLNVTIPYKETIIPYLDALSPKAEKIGAVNTIKCCKSGKLIGYNTDCHGFRKSLKPMLKPFHHKALILGTGGASKAVAYALGELGIEFRFVSRNASPETIAYGALTEAIFADYLIVINTTPLGTAPDLDKCPNIPYQLFTDRHIAYDLTYNPATTLFLQNAERYGAVIKNGLEMLELQADKSWEIWNS
jgi:shikimate dehydrogenase